MAGWVGASHTSIYDFQKYNITISVRNQSKSLGLIISLSELATILKIAVVYAQFSFGSLDLLKGSWLVKELI